MSNQDLPLFTALLTWVEGHSMPRLRAIKASLDNGEQISEYDLMFFANAINQVKHIVPVAQRHQECQEFVVRLSCFYREIVDQAVINESKAA